MTSPVDHSTPPLFSVVKGNPTNEELAAVIAVLSAAPTSTDAPGATSPVTGWSAYWRTVRSPVIPGVGAWRASGRPTVG